MLKYLLIFLLILTGLKVDAQTNTVPKKGAKEWTAIRTQLGLRKYEATLPELQKFVSKYPDYIPGRKFLAESYLYTFRYKDAAEFIQETINSYPPADKDWWAMAAEAHQKMKQYPEAISALKKLKDSPNLGLSYQRLVGEEIEKLEYTWYMIQHPVSYQPIHLGDEINTEAYELYPFLSPERDRLYFTRKDKNEDLYYAEKVNDKWTNVTPLPFNTNDNEGAQTVSADGKLILYTACNHPKGLGSCDIFYSILHNGKWTAPGGIGPPINSTDWESQPFISANGMAIIFSSNRPGGKGGKDLYISYLNKENKWMVPQNLGDVINTPGDEGTPFLHADGRTLYFSSNGHLSVGAQDLYMSRLSDDGTWSKPVNLGYPINTEGDESSIYVELDGKSAYLASNRTGGRGKLDIYQFVLQDSVQAEPATYVKAVVKDARTQQLLDVQYSIYNFDDNSLFANGRTQKDGAFLICMPVENTFRLQIEKSGYVFHSEQFQPQSGTMMQPYLLEVDLHPIEEGASVILKNVLFQINSFQLEEVSFPELQKVIDLMTSDNKIHAVIKGHTDNVGTPEYNTELSRKRAQSVVDYLVKNGIDSGRLTAKGLGDTEPIASNDTEEGRQANRRTEFVIVPK